MHCDIYEINTTGLCTIGRDDLPENFVGSIADYVQDRGIPASDKDTYVLAHLPVRKSGDGYTLDSDRITSYFSHKYEDFRKAVKEMLVMSYDEFKDGEAGFPAYRLESAVDDRYGVYILDEENGLMTLDRWLRYTLSEHPDRVFRVGSILDYHF